MRGEFAWWTLLGMSAFALLFPHLVAGEMQDPGPLRPMALAAFLAAGFVLVDTHLLDSALFRSIAPVKAKG